MADLGRRIEQHAAALPPAERRVAEAILADPSSAAFATVAELGRRAGTSGATVVRLAERLGYDGWVGLQAEARQQVDRQLRPARERIRQGRDGDVLGATAERDAANVHQTLAAVDRRSFDRAVRRLADPRARVVVVAGDAEAGIGALLADMLGMLRPGVSLADGPPPAVARVLAHLGRRDVVVAIDLRRYERWLLDAAALAADRHAEVLAVTDSQLSPLARRATATFVVAAEGAGPFDSHVGTLALANALASAVAGRLGATAPQRLDALEQAWTATASLVADGEPLS